MPTPPESHCGKPPRKYCSRPASTTSNWQRQKSSGSPYSEKYGRQKRLKRSGRSWTHSATKARYDAVDLLLPVRVQRSRGPNASGRRPFLACDQIIRILGHALGQDGCYHHTHQEYLPIPHAEIPPLRQKLRRYM